MANYFNIGAALPTLKQGEYRSHELTSKQFLEILSKDMPARDRSLVNLILLKNDNHILIQLLKGHELTPIDPSLLVLGVERLQYLIEATQINIDYVPDPYSIEKPELPQIDSKEFPKYMIDFVKLYLTDQKRGEVSSYFYEDVLSLEYAKYVQKKGDTFLKNWFAFEQDIASIFAAITAERYQLDASKYILGDKSLYSLMRSGDWKEISYLEDADMVKRIRTISEEEHLAIREQKVDALKWEVLDEVTFADLFSIDAMMVYLLKLQILERWERLDKVQGEQKFRNIVSGLNNEGRDELEQFKSSMTIRKKSQR